MWKAARRAARARTVLDGVCTGVIVLVPGEGRRGRGSGHAKGDGRNQGSFAEGKMDIHP